MPRNPYFFGDEPHAPTPGFAPKPVVKRPPKTMSVFKAVNEGTWSLGAIDKAVRQGFLELFVKTGVLYIRVL